MKEKLKNLKIELIYKGMMLVDLNKVLELIDEETPEDSTDVLVGCLEEMQSCLQKVSRRTM